MRERGRRLCAPVGGLLVFQSEPGFDRYLVVLDLAVLDMAADLDDLEPAEVSHRKGSLRDRAIDGLGDALLGTADELDDLVNMFRHWRFLPMGSPAAAPVAASQLTHTVDAGSLSSLAPSADLAGCLPCAPARPSRSEAPR